MSAAPPPWFVLRGHQSPVTAALFYTEESDIVSSSPTIAPPRETPCLITGDGAGNVKIWGTHQPTVLCQRTFLCITSSGGTFIAHFFFTADLTHHTVTNHHMCTNVVRVRCNAPLYRGAYARFEIQAGSSHISCSQRQGRAWNFASVVPFCRCARWWWCCCCGCCQCW